MKRTAMGYWVLLALACAPTVLAADDVAPRSDAWPWWPEMQWSAFGWVFPLICFGIMLVMFLLVMRGGCVACLWRNRPASGAGPHDSMKQSGSDPCASALATLNERYARGEIGKQEYEEKKIAIR